MLSETHWQIIRRWWGLMAACALVFAIIGMQLLPGLLGKPAPYSSSVTLGVGSFVSPDGAAPSDTALASYADSIAKTAKSQQFLTRLGAKLAEQGVIAPTPVLSKDLTVTADLGLHRVKVEAQGGSAEQTELIANQAAQLLIADAAEEQTRVSNSLNTSTSQRATDLQNRLSQVYLQRVDRLKALNLATYELSINSLIRQGREFDAIMENLARLTGDGTLARLNLEATAIETELATLANQGDSTVDSLQALFLVDPARTVPTNLTSTLGGMEAAVIGGILGLVLGWIAANFAERWRPKDAEAEAAEPDGSPGMPGRAIALLKTTLSRAESSILAGPQRALAAGPAEAPAQARAPEQAIGEQLGPPEPEPAPPKAPAKTAAKAATGPVAVEPQAEPAHEPQRPHTTAAPVMIGWKTIIVSPLSDFGQMYDLKKTLAQMPGIEQVQVSRFKNDVLELEVEYLEGFPLKDRLRELQGFGKTKVTEDDGYLELALGKSRRS